MQRKVENLDDLIQGIESILAKNRSSLSVDEITQIEKGILSLHELKKVVEPVKRRTLLIEFLTIIIKVFVEAELIDVIRAFLRD
jgi:hypothetical protein